MGCLGCLSAERMVGVPDASVLWPWRASRTSKSKTHILSSFHQCSYRGISADRGREDSSQNPYISVAGICYTRYDGP